MDELLKQLPDLILKVGLPTTMLIAFVYLLAKKVLYTAATVEAKDQHLEFVIKEKDEQLNAERAQKQLAENTAQQALDTMQEVLRLTHGVVLQAVRETDEKPDTSKRSR